MTDIKKVLNGLECCTADLVEYHQSHFCNMCPYKSTNPQITYCFNKSNLMRDALSLLKAQQPRVLTLDEVEDALDEVVWIESPNCDNTSERYALVSAYSRKTVYYLRDFECRNDMRMYLYTEYNKTWRCWNVRPTDAERQAAKWDE